MVEVSATLVEVIAKDVPLMIVYDRSPVVPPISERDSMIRVMVVTEVFATMTVPATRTAVPRRPFVPSLTRSPPPTVDMTTLPPAVRSPDVAPAGLKRGMSPLRQARITVRCRPDAIHPAAEDELRKLVIPVRGELNGIAGRRSRGAELDVQHRRRVVEDGTPTS